MCKVNSSLYYVQKSATRPSSAGETHWIPNTDVYVSEGTLIIKVELSGMRREDLELTVEGNRLMISGQRPDDSRNAKCKFFVMEISYGPFECVIEIPPGFNLGHAKAAYQNGFLRVEVPRATLSTKAHLVPVSEGK